MPLQPGEIIDGKYRIIRLLGEGGMGAVYEGENTRIKRTVAIKVLHAAVAEKADVVQRFEREAQAAGRIGSEHIVEVLDLGNLPSGERFMVMEYLDGEDLTGRIKRFKRLSSDQVAPLLHQVLEGLAAAHDAGIIHRDLKPDNIYLTTKAGKQDFVKLLDFGVSKFSALDSEMSMTRTGAVMGTPYYMSPEQAKGGKVTNRSDIYAIGVVTYQMLTGRVPFNAGSFNELLFKIALESPEPIEQVVPGISPAFAQLVHRAMDRDPEQRFQSARDFQRALAEVQQSAIPMQAGSDPRASQLDLANPLTPSGQHQAPQMMGQHPGLSQSNPHLGASGSQLAQSGAGLSGSYPGVIPGTNTPGLGVSQAALAVTPQPGKSKGPVMFAILAVAVAIIGAGGAGAYLLTRPTTTQAAQSPKPEPTPEATVDEIAADATEPASTASSEPDPAPSASDSAEAVAVAPPPRTPTTRRVTPPVTAKPPEPAPTQPKQPPPPPTAGRKIQTTL